MKVCVSWMPHFRFCFQQDRFELIFRDTWARHLVSPSPPQFMKQEDLRYPAEFTKSEFCLPSCRLAVLLTNTLLAFLLPQFCQAYRAPPLFPYHTDLWGWWREGSRKCRSWTRCSNLPTSEWVSSPSGPWWSFHTQYDWDKSQDNS